MKQDDIMIEGVDNSEAKIARQSYRGIENNDALVSDEINDIISHKPNWIVRHSVSSITLISTLLILSSWFVRYPDVLRASMTIVALNAPKKVLARSEGKLHALLVKNGEIVMQHQPLMFIQSTGNHNEVFAFRKWIESVEEMVTHDNIETLLSIKQPQHTSIGELQQSYLEFQTAYREALQTIPQGYYEKKLQALRKDISFMAEQREILLKQKSLLQEDYEIQQTDYRAREHLTKEQVIAPLEFGLDKSKFISKASGLQQIEAQILSQKINVHNKEKEIAEAEKQIADLQSNFFSSLQVFKNKVDEWISRYVVLSPESGELLYITALQKNQFIHSDQELFYVEPKNSGFYGEVVASQAGFGKVAVGQSVVVHIESYPSAEFGYLRGKVTYISSTMVRDSSFLIHVTLQPGMRTNYNKVIPFRNNMNAKAEIVTQDRRLLEKLFSNLVDKIRM